MSSQQNLKTETWVWYGVSLVALLSRYWSQYLRKGNWRGFYADDVLILFCFCCYTVSIVIINEILKESLNYEDPTSPEAFKAARYAAIRDILVETCQLTTLWGVKACFLIVYYRLTNHLAQQKVVIAVAIYCALLYIVIVVLLYCGFCHPFSNYFVPIPTDSQCYSWINYSIVEMVFNISSDCLIIGVPISVIWRSRMDFFKKLGVCAIFSLGIFIVIAACLTKFYFFTSAAVNTWVAWYAREASMAVIVANIVLCRPLITCIYEKTSSLLRTWKPLSSRGAASGTRSSVATTIKSENNIRENSTKESYDDTQHKEAHEVV